MKKQLPEFLNAKHIKDILQISYSEACKILELKTLPVIIIGKTKRVYYKDFNRWLNFNECKGSSGKIN